MISEENSNYLNYCFPVGSVFLWPLKKNFCFMCYSVNMMYLYDWVWRDSVYTVWRTLCLQFEGFCVCSLRGSVYTVWGFCVFSLRGSTTCIRSEDSVYTVWKTLCLQSEGFYVCSLRGSVYAVWGVLFIQSERLCLQSEGFCLCSLRGSVYAIWVDSVIFSL